MTEIDDAWKALNKNGFALDYDEDSRPGALAKAIDYALAAKDDEIGRRDERISELEAQVWAMKACLEAYEQWEADIVLENKCWTGQNVKLTDELYERMIEIQGMRNQALQRLSDLQRAKSVLLALPSTEDR